MPPRKKQPFLKSRGFLVGGTIVAILIAFSASRELYTNHTMQQEIRALEEEAVLLEARRLELLGLAEKLESGEFLEREARLELGLRRPGEQVVVVQPRALGEGRVDRGSRTNPQLWWDYFIHRD
jgi:cell division protein FtsB